MNQRRDFGRLFRKTREQSGRTMGEVARFLGMTVQYLSDVERGERPPLPADKIIRASTYMGTDPVPIIAAASAVKGTFLLDADVTPAGREAGAFLTRAWREFSDEDFEAIVDAVQNRRRK